MSTQLYQVSCGCGSRNITTLTGRWKRGIDKSTSSKPCKKCGETKQAVLVKVAK